MKENKLSTQPYKGSRDFYPEDTRIREYIFNTWKRVCERYGYEMYDGPFIENLYLYAAKSGQELVNEQLYSFEDRGGRKVAIRPEMTPTLSRMVAGRYKTLTFPIRWFSIPNLWRYEKPQKGRLREHFQLNADMFGVSDTSSDFEIISLLVGILREFGAKDSMFEIRINNRRLMDSVFSSFSFSADEKLKTSKIIDKKNKVSKEEFKGMLSEILSKDKVDNILKFLSSPNEVIESNNDIKESQEEEIKKLLDLCSVTGISKFVKYDPSIIRGLDYYTGNVFELYDLSEEGSRAMCGGGRYDDLVKIFIDESISGIGFGMGDVTMLEFLNNWNLLPNFESTSEYFVSVWPDNNSKFLKVSLEIANTLREKKKNVLTWLDTNTKLEKQLKYADRKGTKYAVIIGENEIKDKSITIKNLKNGKQETKSLENFFSSLE